VYLYFVDILVLASCTFYDFGKKPSLFGNARLGKKSSVKQVRAYYMNEKVIPKSISETGTNN
jgi:hypothetical protein